MKTRDIIIGGYVCMDIIPHLHESPDGNGFRYIPGALIETEGTTFSSGGAVANTGIALVKLGAFPHFSCRVGTDVYGRGLRDLFASFDPELNDLVLDDESGVTGHTFIISPPHQDRMFMVCTGVNGNYRGADVPDAALQEVRLLHFGYPPLLTQSQRDNGADTLSLFQRAQQHGCGVSLDMSLPDPGSAAGQVDWRSWLENVLPSVDIFLPSLDEICWMLYGESPTGDSLAAAARVADDLAQYNLAVLGIKMGNQGFYLRTNDDEDRFAGRTFATGNAAEWCGREIYVPCLDAEVVGTTGAGDCTIAGFLIGVLRGESAERSGLLACAVGSASVEAAGAFQGIGSFTDIEARLAAGWKPEPTNVDLTNWSSTDNRVYCRRK